MHSFEPFLSAKAPFAQLMQFVAPSMLEYVPIAHDWQFIIVVDSATVEKVPVGHFVQVLDAKLE